MDVLVLDDWATTREMVVSALRRAGHGVGVAGDGAAAIRGVKAHRPGVVLVDAGMASRDDWQLIGRLRDTSSVAILVVMGPDEDSLKIQALNRGADDFLVKPVRAEHLVARVGAHLRLLRRMAEPAQAREEIYRDGLVEIHHGLRRVSVGGHDLDLTPLEFRLMTALVRHRHRVVSRQELQEMAWHGSAGEEAGDHVRLYVHYLRRKLASVTSSELIQTVRGFGYRWVGPEEQTERTDQPGERRRRVVREVAAG